MKDVVESEALDNFQKIFLVLAGLLLASFLFFFKGGFSAKSPLDQLAKNSLDPEIALSNGRPTVVEFYADWCEACRKMAPSMISIEREVINQVDIVLLNVDNSRWEDLVKRYQVNGIPQLSFFDADGVYQGRSLGVRTEEELSGFINSLKEEGTVPNSMTSNKNKDFEVSLLQSERRDLTDSKTMPMSHA